MRLRAPGSTLVGTLTSVVFGLFPHVLSASTDPSFSLTVHNAKAGEYGPRIGLIWWVIGMALAVGYLIYIYRHFAGKVKLDTDHEGY